MSPFDKVSKGAKIRNRYNQVQHQTQLGYQWESDKLTVIDTTNESQEVSPLPAGEPQGTYKQTHTKA